MHAEPASRMPLERLVLFLIIAALAGGIAAGAIALLIHINNGNFVSHDPDTGPRQLPSCKECMAWCTKSGASAGDCAQSPCWNACRQERIRGEI